jgi:hypothetical protein
MFHRNPKSQNTISVSECVHRLIVVACVSFLALHTGQAQAQVGLQSAAPNATTATDTDGTNTTLPPATPGNNTATAATTADPTTRVLAREFAQRGIEAFEREAFAEALDDFNRAAVLLDAPTIAIMQARSLVKLGRWLEGLDRYQQLARYVLNPADPAPYRDAVKQAGADGEALRQQLPRLSLLVDAEVQNQIVVELDGQVLPSLLLNTSRPVDPGTHQVKASHNGVSFVERQIDALPGQQVELQLSLPLRKARAPEAQHDSSRSPPPVAESSNNWPLIGVATVGGLGGIGVGVATVLGSSAQTRLDGECTPNGKCPDEQQRNLDALETARTLFYVSSALFVIGGGLTAYLLLANDGRDGAHAKLSLSPFGAQVTTIF